MTLLVAAGYGPAPRLDGCGITTRKVGTKWHGYIAGRPDLDETALSEEAVRPED